MATEAPKSSSVWYKIVHLEPALWRGLIVAVFTMLASFGILVSDDVPDNLISLVLALAAIIQALWTRQAVVPEDKVVVWKDERQNLRAGEAVPTRLPGQTSEDLLHRLEEAAHIRGKVF